MSAVGGSATARRSRKPSFPTYPPPEGKVWYTTTEGVTIPVSERQRAVALTNIENNGLPRPAQYDDASGGGGGGGFVDPESPRTAEDDAEEAKRRQLARPRADGGLSLGLLTLLRLLAAGALVLLSVLTLTTLQYKRGQPGYNEHLATREGSLALGSLVAYVFVSLLLWQASGGHMTFVAALVAASLLGTNLLVVQAHEYLAAGALAAVIVFVLDALVYHASYGGNSASSRRASRKLDMGGGPAGQSADRLPGMAV